MKGYNGHGVAPCGATQQSVVVGWGARGWGCGVGFWREWVWGRGSAGVGLGRGARGCHRKGCRVFCQDFAEEFIKTTRGWSRYWLDDGEEDLANRLDDAEGEYEYEHVMHLLNRCAPGADGRRPIATYAQYHVCPPEPVEDPTEKTECTGFIKQKGTNYFCFGMGSLINTPSRVGTAGKVAQCAIPIAISKDYEFCPCWNFQNRAGGSQLTAGGMVKRRDPRNKTPDAETVGVVYPGA